jgi:surface protein
MKQMIYTLLISFVLLLGSCKEDEPAFVTTWDVKDTITLPLVANGEYNFTVNWGDETEDLIESYNDERAAHYYDTPGYYDVTIKGTLVGWSFTEVPQSNKELVSIRSWGTMAFGNTEGQFFRCVSLESITADDSPDLSNTNSLHKAFCATGLRHIDLSGFQWNTSTITDMSYMFYNSDYLDVYNTTPIDWDTSGVNDMSGMFGLAVKFNGDISLWDTSNVRNMESLFESARNFQGDISQWDVSQVENMESMFNNADGFTGDISKWNTGKVTNMRRLFYENDVFNGDISDWDTSSVINMDEMFVFAKAFNQDTSSWDRDSVIHTEH